MKNKIVTPISEVGNRIVVPLSEEDIKGLFDLVQGLWASVCYRLTDDTGQEVEISFIKEEEDLNNFFYK